MDDPTTLALVAAAVVLVLAVVLGSRRRRIRSLDPVQLGPRWQPSGFQELPRVEPGDDERVDLLSERTGLDRATVSTVLVGWEEHLSVIGVLTLPAEHTYRVYDPYSPPIPERGADGRPVADPARATRDIATRTRVSEADARSVLDALLSHDEDPALEPSDPEGTGAAGPAA